MRIRMCDFRVLRRLRAAVRDQRGVSAVTVALSLAVLAPMALGVFDVFTMSEQRGKLQDARSNFLKAYELAPNDPTVANNLKLLSSSVQNIER